MVLDEELSLSGFEEEAKGKLRFAIGEIGRQLFPENPNIIEKRLRKGEEGLSPPPLEYLPLAIVRIKSGPFIEGCLLNPTSSERIEKLSGESISGVLGTLCQDPRIIKGVHVSLGTEVDLGEIGDDLQRIVRIGLLSPGTQFWFIEIPSYRPCTFRERKREKEHKKRLIEFLKEVGLVDVNSVRISLTRYSRGKLEERGRKTERPESSVLVQTELRLK